MLTQQEFKRYNRHIIVPEIGLEGQLRLKNSKVLVIGAGGLGCPVLQYLTAAGVGTIGIVDFDGVDESNLQRQVLFNSMDVGGGKAKVAEEKLGLNNPHVHISVFPVMLTSTNALEIIKGFDIVVDGSDNFATRYLVNDACVILNKPLIFGSIFKFEGQVTVFNYNGGPTYRCLFPEPPKAGEVPNCSEIGVLGVLPGIIGTLQANEVIKIIIGIGEVLSGRLFVIDALTMATQTYKFSKVDSNTRLSELGSYENVCEVEEDVDKIKEINVSKLKEMIESNEDFQLIDVRNAHEYELCNLGGRLIPMNKIHSSVDQISRDRKVVVHCHHGGRSAQVIQYLQENLGFKNLYNLKGGIHEWSLQIDNQIPTY